MMVGADNDLKSINLGVFYMKKITYLLTFTYIFLFTAITATASAGKGDQFSTTPVLNNGKKWRCAYYEGGHYSDYQVIFQGTILGLVKLGWIKAIEFPPYNPDHGAFWQWLCKNVKSDYLEFVPDAFYSSDFKMAIRKKTRDEFIKRLQEKKDIDFIFAMGTWAGQDLANNEHSVPTMVCSSSDPIGSKIVKSAEDSGFDHLMAKVDPDRYERQVQLFFDMVGFKKLGVVYENTVEGRTYAAVDKIEKVAKDNDLEIVSCEAPFSNIRKRVAREKVVECYTKIAPQVEAVYITTHQGVTLANLPKILTPLNKLKIPTFSMKGSEEVKHGVLMSISQANFKYVGEFQAEVMGKIFNGAKPREINQIFRAPGKIALNLKTAQTIDFDPPVDILMAADEIFETVEVSDENR